MNEISTGEELFIEITPKLDDITNATLHVGSETFAFADASVSSTTIVGWGSAPSWSKDDTITVKLVQAKAPSAPKNLRAKGVSTTQIDLSWDAPEKTGGKDVTGYKIEVSEDGVSGWTELVASQEATTYTHVALMAGTMRYYRVSAINDAGTGAASGVALGRTAAVSERLSLWGLLGYGTGELDVEVDGVGRWSTDTTQEMAAAGVRGVLVKAPETGGLELGVRGDAVVQRMRSEAARGSDGGTLGAADARTSRLRLALEGSRAVALEGGGRFVPRLEVGLRQDGGDAETGTGIEVGGGLAWTAPARGLTVEAKARTLVAHEDAHYREWGASGSVRIDPGASGRGLSLTLAPAWGAAEGGAERLWGLGDARGLAPDAEAPAGSRLEAELGYGFAVIGGRGVATPYAGLSRSETGETLRLGQRLRTGASQWKVESAFGEAERSARVGYGYRLGPSLELSVEATRREAAADDAPEHGVMLRLGARW